VFWYFQHAFLISKFKNLTFYFLDTIFHPTEIKPIIPMVKQTTCAHKMILIPLKT